MGNSERERMANRKTDVVKVKIAIELTGRKKMTTLKTPQCFFWCKSEKERKNLISSFQT